MQTPILVQGGQSLVSAHPVGAVAGPVIDGQFTQGQALTPTIAATAPPGRPVRAFAPAPCTAPAEKIPMPRPMPKAESSCSYEDFQRAVEWVRTHPSESAE